MHFPIPVLDDVTQTELAARLQDVGDASLCPGDIAFTADALQHWKHLFLEDALRLVEFAEGQPDAGDLVVR